MATIKVVCERRKAIYRPKFDRPSFGIAKGQEILCDVWGCFQCNDGDVDYNPYFVIELPDGHCTYATIEDIQFTKEDEADA